MLELRVASTHLGTRERSNRISRDVSNYLLSAVKLLGEQTMLRTEMSREPNEVAPHSLKLSKPVKR